MSAIDCSKNSTECGSLTLLTNFSKSGVRIDIQYPGNSNVWYAIGTIGPQSVFQISPMHLHVPGDSLLRAVKLGDESKNYLVGKILAKENNYLNIPINPDFV